MKAYGINIAEGSNLYFTDARVGQYITASTTLATSVNYWNKVGSDLNYVAGNVGIGTTTPNNKLSVSGNVTFTGNIGGGNAAADQALHLKSASGNTNLRVESSGSTSDFFDIFAGSGPVHSVAESPVFGGSWFLNFGGSGSGAL